METKEKNKKLLIIVGVLLLFGGISLAYFVNKILTNGDGGKANVTTAVIKGATINVEGVISFEDLEILPGHKSVSGIKLTATGNNELIPYNLIWKGTNTLTTPLNYTIYKTSEEINVTSTCEVKKKIVGSVTQLSEECNISNIDRLGSEIAKGTINKNESKVTLVKDEFITATSTGDIKYYYVILEYPNLEEAQNYDLEGSLEGEVTVEESNIKPDINIIAAYIEQDNGEYTEVEDIPQEGYTVNSSKSTCSNGATPIGITPDITIKGLTKSGTSCYLYFNKSEKEINTVLGNIIVKSYKTDFSVGSYINEGIYTVNDDVYGGNSYYWRGDVNDNYLKFGGYCWRIIRINGDGTLRLIYDGSTCHQNGEVTTDSIAVSNIPYNIARNRSEYVGWTYVEEKQRPETGDIVIDSNAKAELEKWYNANLASYNDKIAEGKFCNDRNVGTGYTWATNGSTFNYASLARRDGNKPTLACNSSDIYTLKVGLITMDEVIYAGGRAVKNDVYYLYNGQNYWTMTPRYWNGTGSYASVFFVRNDGYLESVNVSGVYSLRPVINLKSDVTVSGGDGTLDNPYIVL